MTAIAPRLFVDSADLDRVSRLLEAGGVHGVTTNPTILERGGRTAAEIPDLYARWESEGAREIFFQTWGGDTASFLRNAEGIRALGDRVVVKVPATTDGFAAASALVRDGATVLVTAVYSVAQALASASIGVTYIAPYLGRMRDAAALTGFSGPGAEEVIARMQDMCTGSSTDVLAASLRSPEDIIGLRMLGIPYFTAAPDVLERMLQHDVSDSSAAEFDAAMGRLGA
ncbi:transaldolase family protein [Microbacterium sp. SA39]|uniref:transaldolase family protein n=1 Tax=Microbacterium sp. SA39 TaxID=1263625 RepID=UPI0005F9D33F|nr:transaldolase family protein [Microbacterium sp. SA39]KJQ55183.1 putative transaldolase [Microbacterium sp. SA39]